MLYLDLARWEYKTCEDLLERLTLNLRSWEAAFGVAKVSDAPDEQFAYIIEQIHLTTGKQVVVLVDEYDKPLFESLDNEPLNAAYYGILRGFYSVIKSLDAHIRFAFLTGITKFSKVSVFSGLNNLRDISLVRSFSGICGITAQELSENFKPYITALSEQIAKSQEETLVVLKREYDGYLFAADGEKVYNPFSLLNVFASERIEPYWFATGTPTFLINYLRKVHYNIPDLENRARLSASRFDSYRADMLNPLPILFHTGYLTIKEYVSSRNYYRLGYPNDEVRYGFLNNLRSSFLPPDRGLGISIFKFLHDIDTQDVSAFMERLQTVFANLPYDTVAKEDIKFRERDYQIVVYLIFALLGQYVQTEVQSVTGRADCVVDTPTTVYIFELKLWSTGTAEDALTQIRTKGYGTPYKSSGKEVILIGASFDAEKRNIGEWKVERL